MGIFHGDVASFRFLQVFGSAVPVKLRSGLVLLIWLRRWIEVAIVRADFCAVLGLLMFPVRPRVLVHVVPRAARDRRETRFRYHLKVDVRRDVTSGSSIFGVLGGLLFLWCSAAGAVGND